MRSSVLLLTILSGAAVVADLLVAENGLKVI